MSSSGLQWKIVVRISRNEKFGLRGLPTCRHVLADLRVFVEVRDFVVQEWLDRGLRRWTEKKTDFIKHKFFVLWGHSNNTWHFFGTFMTPSPSRVTFLIFWSLIFRSNLPWTVKYNMKKVSLEAKIMFQNVHKVCVALCRPPPLKCHVLFEWPLSLFGRTLH